MNGTDRNKALASLVLGLVLSAAAWSQTKVEELSGWVVDIGKVESVKEGTKATNVVIPLPGMIAGSDLVIPEVVYDETGRVLRSAEGTVPVELRGTNGFRMAAESYSLGPRGLHLNGVVFLPDALGGKGLRFPKGRVFLEPDGALIAETTAMPVAWATESLSAFSATASVGRSGLTLGPGTVTVPNSSPLPFGAARFLIDGSLAEADSAEGPPSLEIQGILFTDTHDFRISENRFTTNAGEEVSYLQLKFSGDVHLPRPFQNAGTYGGFVVGSTGRVVNDNEVSRGDFDLSYNGVEVHFNRPRFDSNDGFRIDEPEIRLSPAMGGSAIRIDSFLLRPSGKFDLYGFSTAPIDFWGMPISFEKIGFTEKGFTGESGYARLGQGGAGALSGFAVKSFSLGFDGKLGQAVFALSDDYLEVSDTLALENPQLSAAQTAPGTPLRLSLSGTIGLRTTLGATTQVHVLSLPLEGAPYRFAVEKLQSAPVVFEQGGLKFELEFQGINEEGAFLFRGNAKVLEKSALPRWPSAGASGYLVTQFVIGGNGLLTAQFLVPGKVSPFTAHYDNAWLLGLGL